MLLIPTLLCPKSWEGMSGNDTERFCTHCQKQVHNLEALSVSERLALLSSPAGKICSRYKAAIRRPAKGKEAAYHRHLVKYGAGVAIAGSVILVLWEMRGAAEKERYYRATGITPGSRDMPRSYYEEHQTRLMGDVCIEPPKPRTPDTPAEFEPKIPDHVDLKLDPAEIDKLTEPVRPVSSEKKPD